ncbi:hypothetical protein V6N13_096602 [Hibiscus sabdariffa]
MVVSQTNDTHDSKLDGPYDVLMPGGEGGANQSMQVDGSDALDAAQTGGTRSYAATVSGATAAKVPAKSVLNPNDIVVANDDVTTDDSGSYTEMCGQMGEATEAPGTPANNLLPFPNKGQALSKDEMYGPWMIVSDKKKRQPRKKTDSGRELELNSGKSRFAVLSNVEAEEQVTPIVAAIDANAGIHCEQPSSSKTGASSSCGKKGTKKGTKVTDQGPQVLEANIIDVEPTIPGQVPYVVGDGLRSKGHHKEVSIVEDGTALDGGKRGGLKKGLKGVSNLKLQVRKQSVFKAPNLPLLSEWVNLLSCNVSVGNHSHVPVDSSSPQGDPPDTRSHTNNVHGNGPKVNLGDTDMVQIGNIADPTTVLGQ